jgi:hypothetical protein
MKWRLIFRGGFGILNGVTSGATTGEMVRLFIASSPALSATPVPPATPVPLSAFGAAAALRL